MLSSPASVLLSWLFYQRSLFVSHDLSDLSSATAATQRGDGNMNRRGKVHVARLAAHLPLGEQVDGAGLGRMEGRLFSRLLEDRAPAYIRVQEAMLLTNHAW